MALIGKQLLEPEAGWKRIDEINANIIYKGTWSKESNAAFYGGSQNGSYTNGATIEFNVKTKRIRIMASLWLESVSSKLIDIYIDGVLVGNYSQIGLQVRQGLWCEFDNLKNEGHIVKIVNKSTLLLNIDAIDIDVDGEIAGINHSFVNRKVILKNQTTNKYYSLTEKTLNILPNASVKNMDLYGNAVDDKIPLDETFNKIRTVTDNEDDTQTITEEDVEPFSIYDVFGDEMEVLYYTEDESVTEADLIINANWSPVDELEGDFEVVTWTDEENASKKLELNAIPSPQFIHTTTLSNVTGELKNLVSSDLSTTTNNSNVRYLLTKDNVNWLKWNGSDFTNVSFTNKKDILNIGMTYAEITAISDWSKWVSNKINIGVYLQDDDTTTSKVGTLGFTESSSNQSTKLSNVNFYILNTTAKIELDLQGLLLSGHLSDLDSTRVQYKVTLNGQPYYPLSGDYTSLSPSPQNIEIVFKSSEIKMNDWNTLRVDFKDYFGTEDYWQTTFVGNYSALMFMDVDGNYYSDDIGKVLQYLDFGTIVAGEVTVAHEVIVKNQYGYAVKDMQLEASRSHLPEGVDIQLSKVNDPFEPEQSLLFEDGLNFEDQTSFYVRMVTDVDSVPNDTKSFNIFVKASRKGV